MVTTGSAPARHLPVAAVAALVVLGLVLIAVGVVYFVEPAGSLPAVFPGHAAGSPHKHLKHGLLAAGLGVVALLGAWLGTGTGRAAS